MAFVIVDGVIVNDAFATPASATSQPVDAVLGLSTWSASGGGNNQSLAITLDSVSASVTQTLAHSQGLTATLDSVTVAIAQSKSGANSQALAITLDTVAVAVNQTATHAQALNITLDSITSSITQAVVHTQSVALTLDSIAVAASQSKTGANSQALAITLDSVTSSVTQVLSHSQSITALLDDISVSISQSVGSVSKSQQLSITLDDVTASITQANTNIAITGAADYGSSKKKYIIRKDGQLLTFNTKQEALALLNDEISATDELNALIDIDVSEKLETQPQAHYVAPSYDIKAMLQTLQDNAIAQQLLNDRQYQAFISIYNDYMDEQDIELLLMAA